MLIDLGCKHSSLLIDHGLPLLVFFFGSSSQPVIVLSSRTVTISSLPSLILILLLPHGVTASSLYVNNHCVVVLPHRRAVAPPCQYTNEYNKEEKSLLNISPSIIPQRCLPSIPPRRKSLLVLGYSVSGLCAQTL